MSKKETILYVGNFSFPLGNAAGKRVYANGKILRELGYKVVFIGMDKEINSSETLKSTQNEYDGFTYYNFPYPNKNLDWLNYRTIFNKLIELLISEEIINDLDFIICYGSPRLSFFITKIINNLKKYNIKVVTDSVDWLTIKTNNFIFDLIKWADNTYQMAYANKKAAGVIAISSYLANYYKKNGRLTVTIPSLSPFDYSLMEPNLICNDRKVITYAGLPFRKGQEIKNCNNLKDRIDKTIKLFYHAKQNSCEFIFNIYGFTKEEYLIVLPEQKKYIDELNDSIFFHGYKSNEEVTASILNSDYSIFIRDVNRDTSAGFPTKFSESISLGTPVITTRTSDLANYLVEGLNGFFLDFDDEIAQQQLNKILSNDSSSVLKMKKYCIENNPLYYMHFIDVMRTFLKELER